MGNWSTKTLKMQTFKPCFSPKPHNYHVWQATFPPSLLTLYIWRHHLTHMLARQNRARAVMTADANSHLALSGCGRTAEEAKSDVGPWGEPFPLLHDMIQRECRCKFREGYFMTDKESRRTGLLEFFSSFSKWSLETTHVEPSSAHVYTYDGAYANSVVLISNCGLFSCKAKILANKKITRTHLFQFHFEGPQSLHFPQKTES